MRLLALTALTMVAFASNSILNRMALAGGTIDPLSFGAIRLIAGAAALAGLAIALRGTLRLWGPGRWPGGISLVVYMIGFSLAYAQLDAGLGALILFGVVQITMFAGALIGGHTPPPRRWLGAGLAFVGLVWLLWPVSGENAQKISLWHGSLMAMAGVGWGIYSLTGRRRTDALQSTAANFVLTAPLAGLLLAALWAFDASEMPGAQGVALAVLAGAVTSGMGYALWYAILPRLDASLAAVAQLTVPVLAMAGGIVLLSEALTPRFALASVIVLAGVALSALPTRQTKSR